MAILEVYVKPGAKQNAVYLDESGRVVLKVRALAIENRANEACIDLLSSVTGLSKKHIRLIRGQRSRTKWFELETWTKKEIDEFLQTIEKPSR